ncbi:MAG: type II toxin-antitoxin system HicB family antitoxin [Anaerolineales bacterium]|nr:type II toxin-antitoxin system HicB family antitoxin [Anaerolineales bacterium]
MTYPILLESKKQGGYRATVLGWPDCTAQGATRQEALSHIRQVLSDRLSRAEIIPLEIEPVQPEHPWLKFAGMFKDNPVFAEVVAELGGRAATSTLEGQVK